MNEQEQKEQEKTEETANESLPEESTEESTENKSLNTLVFDLKKEFEEKIENITKSKNDEIKARDDIIKQLLNGDNKKSTTTTIADRINKKRNFKKW